MKEVLPVDQIEEQPAQAEDVVLGVSARFQK